MAFTNLVATQQGSSVREVGGKIQASSEATWVTDSTIPDPVIDKVLNEYVVVRIESLNNEIKTASGHTIYMPDSAVENQELLTTVGRVIAVGEFAGKRNNVSKPEVGDYVIFPKHSGMKMEINGCKVVFLYDDALMARIDKDKTKISKAKK